MSRAKVKGHHVKGRRSRIYSGNDQFSGLRLHQRHVMPDRDDNQKHFTVNVRAIFDIRRHNYNF